MTQTLDQYQVQIVRENPATSMTSYLSLRFTGSDLNYRQQAKSLIETT